MNGIRFGFLLLWTVLIAGMPVPVHLGADPLVINEFVASNGSVLADEDGDFSDWIELFYSGDVPIDLTGYGLSDNAGAPFKWRFPEVVLDPQSYLLVWASGKDRRDASGPLHTNFAISASGEPLLLTSVDGQLIDRVEPVALLRDQAYARIPDGGNWTFTFSPTPGESNLGAVGEIPVLPEFSHSGGLFSAQLSLGINHPDPNVRILYTLDGSEPDYGMLSGRTYRYKNHFPENMGDELGELLRSRIQTNLLAGDILVFEGEGTAQLYSRTTTFSNNSDHYRPLEPPYTGHVVRARALSPEGVHSAVETRTFFPHNDRMPPIGYLPIIAVTVPSIELFDYYRGIFTPGFFYDQWGYANFYRRGSAHEKPGSLEVFDPDGMPLLQRNVGVRVHGGATRYNSQKSLRISSGSVFDARGEIELGLFPGLVGRTTGLPIKTFRNLLLRNSGNDSLDTRFRDMLGQAVVAPLGLDYQAWQPALQFINGEFWGLINIRERMDRFTLSRHHGVPEADIAVIQITNNGDELDEGGVADLEDFIALREQIRHAEVMGSETMADLAAVLDLDNFLVYHMANIFLKNTDWPGSNIRVWRNSGNRTRAQREPMFDGRWRYIVFDLDFAFGPAWGIDTDHDTLSFALEEGGSDWPNPDWSTVMLRRLVENDAFRHRFIQSFADHWNTTFSARRVYGLISDFEEMLGPLLPVHAVRWRDFLNLGGDMFRDFIDRRSNYVRSHLEDRFGFPGYDYLTIDLSDADAGEVRLNTIRLHRGTPGIANICGPFPWRGLYARGIPMEMEAIAYPGFAFVGWLRDGEFVAGAKQTILLTEGGNHWVALYKRDAERQLLHYWDFNQWDALEWPYWSLGGGRMTFRSEFGEAWKFPTSLQGFMGEGGLFEQPVLVHLGIEQDGMTALEFSVPTTGHGAIWLQYETRRSVVGPSFQWVEVSMDGLSYQLVEMISLNATESQMVRVDLSEVPGVADNASLHIRIRIGGGAGRVFFDDISFWGERMHGEAHRLAWSGISWGGNRFSLPGIGLMVPVTAHSDFLYLEGAGWQFVCPVAEANSFWLYSYIAGGWIYIDPVILPYVFDPLSQEWQIYQEQ